MQKENLTIKQRLFLRHLFRTFSPTEAAMRSYRCKDRLVARVIASQLLSKLNISFTELLEKAGLGLEEDLEDLKRLRKAQKIHACEIMIKDENGELKVNKNSNDWIEVDDCAVQLKALEMSLKLKGVLKERFEHTGADGEPLPTPVINIYNAKNNNENIADRLLCSCESIANTEQSGVSV